MFVTQRISGLYSLLAIAQCFLAAVLYWTHFFIMDSVYAELAQPERYFLYFILLLVGLGMEAAYRFKTNPRILHLAFADKHRIVLRQVISSSAVIAFFLVATKDQAVSRVFLFTFVPLLYLALLLSLQFLPPAMARRLFKKARQENTILVGKVENAIVLQGWLERKKELGIRIVGMLSEKTVESPAPYPVLGTYSDLERVARDHSVSQIIIMGLPCENEMFRWCVMVSEKLGARLVVATNLQQQFMHPIFLEQEDGLQLLGLREEPLENPFNRMIKRLLDLAISIPVVVFVLPICCVIVKLLQAIFSPGPLFYKQERAGLLNQTFTILKFRTMHINNPDPTRQAMQHDPRVFRSGRWLRRYSLDELPQFINVIRGEMSVVGPRPHLIEHNKLFSKVMENYHVRALVKPGITGLAQVRGFRGEAQTENEIRQRVESDIYYIENWSPSLDLSIIVRTVWQVFFPPKSAY